MLVRATSGFVIVSLLKVDEVVLLFFAIRRGFPQLLFPGGELENAGVSLSFPFPLVSSSPLARGGDILPGREEEGAEDKVVPRRGEGVLDLEREPI